MGIDRDEGAERQARVEQMITEFRGAQSRRFGKQNDKAAEAKSDANTNAPVPRSSTPPPQ